MTHFCRWRSFIVRSCFVSLNQLMTPTAKTTTTFPIQLSSLSIFTLIFNVGRLKIKPEKFSFTMVQPNLRISIGLIANWSQFDIQALLQKLLKFSYPCWMGPSPSTPLRVHSWMIQFGSFRCAQMARFLFNSKAIQNLFNSKFFLPK